MKHLLDITNFLVEALTPEFKEKYRKHSEKRTKKVQERLNRLLDNQERVYIPYNSETISGTQLKVKDYLEGLGYSISDYKQNLAVQIENSKRQIRISKLLAKNPELLKEFTLDDTRSNAKVSSELSIVLTSNYEDVAGMSYRRCWLNSCLDIKQGANKKYVQEEVKQGTVVAYLIKSDDLEIEEPLGRVNIKPHFSQRDETKFLYVPDKRVYGNISDSRYFLDKIGDYLKQKQEVEVPGFYFKVAGVYSDVGSPPFVMVRKDGGFCYECFQDEEGYNRFGFDKDGYNREGYDQHLNHRDKGYPYQDLITRSQYNFLMEVKSRNTSNFTVVDNDGVVSVNFDGSVYIYSNINIEEFPVQFGIINGDFDCGSLGLKTLKGAPFEIKGGFDCRRNELKNLEHFPLKVGGEINLYYNELTSLVGCPEIVNGDFDISLNQLNHLDGFPKEVTGILSVRHQQNNKWFSKDDVLWRCKVKEDDIII